MSAHPRMSIVVLTWNEEDNIVSCLESVANQTLRDLEVLVIDAASSDDTVQLVESLQPLFPVPLRLLVAPSRIPIGQARNWGVQEAQAPVVAFLSADAELDATWAERAVSSLEAADMVFGRQEHRPRRWTWGAAVRGLHYHFPTQPVARPQRYASNVAGAYRRDALLEHPFDAIGALEDVLFVERARRAGRSAAYNPELVVRHHDVRSAREEVRKTVREARAWGAYVSELGLQRPLAAWAGLLVIAMTLISLWPGPLAVSAAALALWAPALRRGWRNRNVMPVRQIARGILASPAFDLLTIVAYGRGLLGHPPTTSPKPTKEQQP